MMILYLVGLAFGYFCLHHFYLKRRPYPPGPMPLPLFGNCLQLAGDQMKVLLEWKRQYGKVYTIWLPGPLVLINDYDCIKETVIKYGDVFTGRPDSKVFELIWGGKNGIALADGPLWKEERRFVLRVLRDFGMGKRTMGDRVLDQARILTDSLAKESARPTDPTHPIQTAVANVINTLLFDYTFDAGDPRLIELRDSVAEVFTLFLNPALMFYEQMPWLRFVPFCAQPFHQLKRADARVVAFLRQQLAERREYLSRATDEEPTDLTSTYLQEIERQPIENRDKGIYAEWQFLLSIYDLWTAGMETSVVTLKWALVYLINHPELQERVAAEIRSKIGSDDVNLEDRKRLPLTMATISEVQRIANLLPINLQREMTQDHTINGWPLKKGTAIVPQISNVMVDERFFPHPQKFDPERFIDSKGDYRKIEQLVPFSVGKRSCVGEALAQVELFIFFTTMVQRFRFDPDGEAPSMESVYGFVARPNDFKCVISKRD